MFEIFDVDDKEEKKVRFADEEGVSQDNESSEEESESESEQF